MQLRIFGKLIGLSGCIARFLQDTKTTGHISDKNTHLIGFCQCVEAVFNNGLLQQITFPFTKTTSAWSWLEKCASAKHNVVTFTYLSAVEEAKKYKYILTNSGKLRLLIRICLNEKCLHVPVQYLVSCYYVVFFYNNKIYNSFPLDLMQRIYLSLCFKKCSNF